MTISGTISRTYSITCERCGSGDCSKTTTSCKIALFLVTGVQEYCNECGHHVRRLKVDGREDIVVS